MWKVLLIPVLKSLFVVATTSLLFRGDNKKTGIFPANYFVDTAVQHYSLSYHAFPKLKSPQKSSYNTLSHYIKQWQPQFPPPKMSLSFPKWHAYQNIYNIELST